MAIVDIPGRESLEVPDAWGSDEVTDFVRQRYPDLFEAPALSTPTYGPDRAPLTPEARAARIAEIRGTPAENRRFAEEQSRIADLDALEAAREAGGIRSFLEASDIMAGPRRVAAGASNFLRVPGAIANIQLAPLLGMESTRPAAERAAQLLADLDRSISGAGDVLRSTERRDAEPTLADVARSARDLGPTAALADLGTLGVNAIADSAAYILPGALVARGLAGAGIGEKAARILGPMISVAPVETADALAEYVETNANPIAARVVAPIVGFINGALESVTDAGVLARLSGGDAAKKSAARFLVGQILGEGVTEGLQEGATIGGRAALTGDPGPDALNRLGTAVVGGAFGGAGIGGVTEAVRRMAQPAETPIGARGVPVEVARAELDSGAVPVGPTPPSAAVPTGMGAARDYVPLGKRKTRKVLDFARIAEEEGVADIVDFVPEAKMTPEGVPIEAEFSGGRARVYTPNVRNERRFREALREEKAHGWIATEPGQVALTEFLDRQPLTDAEFTKLQKDGYLQNDGEDVATYTRRLSDEFVAKLNRDPKWKQWVGEAVAWVKKSIGVSLTNTQAGRLMLRNLRRVAPAPVAATPVPRRFSLSPERTEPIVEDIRRQFPSAPPIAVSETPDPRGAFFDGTSIVVSPSTLPSNPATAKSVITAALIESGLTKVFADDFVESTFAMLRAGDPTRTARMAERLGADTKTPEGQRAVLSEVLRLQQDSRRMAPILRRWMAKFKIAESDPLADELDRAMRTTLAAYEGSEPLPSRTATPQEHVFADINRSVWTYARPIIQDLRNRALEERFDAEDTARHRNMSNRMNALADNARAKDLGAGVEQEWNPVDADFIAKLKANQIPVTESDETLHAEYRREALARGLVPTLDAIEDVDERIAEVLRAKPNYDITSDELTDERQLLQRRIDAADKDVLARAMELRSRAERRWQSRAAVEALRDPQIAAWYDIIERIEMSGATPREGPTSPNLADAATIARDTLALTWAPFRRRTQAAYDKFMAEVYPAALTPLRQRLERLRSDRAQAHIAVGEILAALRGVMGLSGSTEDRATAEFLLENDELLRRFIVSLAQATPDGEVARLRDRIMQGEEATEADVRVAARDAGVSVEALTRLAGHLRRSPGIRNAVVEGMAAINRSIADSAISAIREIESDPEAAERMAPVINRFTRSRGRAATAMTGVEQEIQELEARRLNLELLRDAGASEIPESELGVAEMIYDGADGGIILKSFTKADGTEQPQLVIRPGEEYSNATLAQLAEWQENARAAVEAESNEAPVTRGLNVGIQIANLYIDASFTPDQIAKTPAPGMLGSITLGSPLTFWQNVGNRNTLSRMVAGVQGRALKAAARELDLAGQTKDSLTKSYVKRHRRAMFEAAKSLKLDLGMQGDAERLRDARNEVAHRFGRVFEAGPAVGELLISLPGVRITPELMTLIRLDREIGRKAQERERKRNYGGVRVNLPGQRVVRPPAETGDVGLSRSFLGHEKAIRKLAEIFRSKDPMQIVAFWDSADAEDGLLWHVLDAGRTDLGTPRQLRDAEQTAAQRIVHGHVPAPRTFDEMVSLLTEVSGLARSEVRSKLLAELEEYGRLASARFPADGSAPKTTEIDVSGEGDQTPFTMQAAPLIYPSSWYDYGSARSLDQFLEMVVDVPQRAYLTRAKESAADLNATADRILQAVAEKNASELAALDGVIRWYTNKITDMWRGQRMSGGRAQAAADNMRWIAKQLEADTQAVDTSRWKTDSQRAISSVMPFLLSWISTAITNIVSGPLTTFFVYRPLHGWAGGSARAIGQMLLSTPHFILDRAERALEKMGVSIPTRQERVAFLESYGIAGSFSRQEYGESEAWARGDTTAGPLRRGFQKAQDVANEVSERVGVRMGDTVLNQQLTRVVLPGVFSRLQRIHDAWAARLARDGKTYDGSPETLLSEADVAGAPAIREQLGQFGTPEEILMRTAAVNPKTFFRDEVLARIGSFLLSEMNAATRSNRPQSNPLLALLGWTSHVVGLIASDVRTTPDTNRAKAIGQVATRTLAFALVSAFAFYMQQIARRGAQIGQTDVVEALQQILLGLDEDDDNALMEALAAVTRAIRRIPGASAPLDFAVRAAGAMRTPATSTTMTPIDAAWWGQPASDLALDLAAAPVRGIGIDPENPKFPTFGIVDSVGRGGLQAGKGLAEVVQGAIQKDDGGMAAGTADLSEGTRKILSVLSMFGQFTYNMIDPGAVESKAAKADVVRAARDAGIPIEAPKRGTFGGIMPATPVEAALRNAARAGDEDRMRALTKFAFDRSYERAIDKGQSPDEARAAGEASVKSLLTALDPVRDAIGSSITAEQYAKLEPRLTPRVRAEMANRDRAVQVISTRPPEGMRTFRPTPAMMTPVRQERGRGVSRISSRRRGGRRRASYLARRRGAGRRVRRPRLRV